MSDTKRGLTLAQLEKDVANQIIEIMERDGLKWVKSWITPSPCQNALSGHVYSGSNIFTTGLWLMRHETSDPRFMTFKQAASIGAKVKKGSKGIPIIYYGTYQRETEDGEKAVRSRFAKLRHVFHVSQFDEVDEAKLVEVKPPVEFAGRERNPEIDDFIDATGVPVGDANYAAYNEGIDRVLMPTIDHFIDTDEANATVNYYGTLLHEFIHVTGAKKRLDRETMRRYHADKAQRAREELIAEIGAAMLCQRFGLQPAPREDHAAYVKSWCRFLTDKPSEIFTAAAAASKAIQWLDDPKAADVRTAA